MLKTKTGVTLIELLATIVILGVLLIIAIPLISGLIERTQKSANERIIDTLNEATRLYRIGEGILSTDTFEGYVTHSERLNVLFDNGYLTVLPQPMPPYPTFVWHILDQLWILEASNNDDLSTLPVYNFDETRLIDMINQGTTIPNGSFTDTGTSLESGGGVMYIPNPNESYTLILNAQIMSSSTYGGFGLLFDTTASDMFSLSDTGMIVQVDRGYSGGEIIIRPRTQGSESSPLYRFGIRFDPQGNFVTTGGVKDNSNPWWHMPHELKLEVSVVDVVTQEKTVHVYIDDVFLFSYLFVSDLFGANAQNNITGFRSWNGINVAFYELVIET